MASANKFVHLFSFWDGGVSVPCAGGSVPQRRGVGTLLVLFRLQHVLLMILLIPPQVQQNDLRDGLLSGILVVGGSRPVLEGNTVCRHPYPQIEVLDEGTEPVIRVAPAPVHGSSEMGMCRAQSVSPACFGSACDISNST